MRLDIQCLRGIAIILVFLFHLFPNIFVNGFLGVDIFFVISGYLMAKNLTRNELKNLNNFTQFYYRRFRRILPLYYLVIFMTLILVHFYLGDYLWDSNNRYSLASLFLVTNQLIIHDQGDYFNEASSINAFLHLWSLSVEMQFYLLVPFIFLGLQILSHDYLKLIVVSSITFFGFIAFALVLPKFAFNFMFLRLWQFSAGFIALYVLKLKRYKTDEAYEPIFKIPFSKDDFLIISLSIIALCFLPTEINVLFLRPLVTLAAACAINCETENNIILSSKILGYIGDISYSMYLVHWPLIAIFVPYTVKNYIFLIQTIFLSSIVFHHIFERKYQKMHWKTLAPLCFVLILANTLLQINIRSESKFWSIKYPAELREIVEMNKAQKSWVRESKRNECVEEKNPPYGSYGYGSCKGGNGSLSVMMIGNSYVLNFREAIREKFNYNYSSFRFSSVSEGVGFYADSPQSRAALEFSRQQVEKYKPDVLFIVARYLESVRAPIQEDDELVQQMNENIRFYEHFVKKIYILGSHPLYKLNFMNIFLQTIMNRPEDLESLHLDRREADRLMRNVKKRFSMFFNLSHVFLENDKYLTFDRDEMLSYVDNTIHLTSAGLKLCEPALKKVVKEVMDGL
ncbi:hypothetical protein CRE_03557 [Caenorhabditis remanei]|uniref:Acyltransferase 3 domain-containing protein n=1 Tax=Caenorhabditis remanei TaxID=31234 RepID=E3NQZ1_CAERE|nr:hypothetical protein CRE_03557 [Caenorhabditis remanei]